MEKENNKPSQDEYLTTDDGRKIHQKSIEDIGSAGSSWTSGKTLGLGIPEVIQPKLVEGKPPEEWVKKPRMGKSEIIYCTWMGAGEKVDFNFIKKQIKAFRKLDIHPTVFIIDAGWTARAGDWLSTDKQKFPDGLEEATKLIKGNNIKPFLWLAPLHAEKNSDLAKEHPDWFIQHHDYDKPISYWYKNTAFGKTHYLLDLRKKETVNYLEKVAQKVKNWGFEGVKLDFLSSLYLVENMSQEEKQLLTHKTMAIFKEKDLIILASGAPFNAAIGIADLIRLSSDSGLPNLPKNILGEGVNSYLVRHHLKGVEKNRRLISKFINIDPDMYYSNSVSNKDKQKLKKAQILSLYRAGCLTLGDDFSRLSSEDAVTIKELITKFYRAQRLHLTTKEMVRKNCLDK
jgi:hypothetical protein